MKSLLHIGCGPKTLRHLPGYFQSGWAETRLDIDAAVSPDILASMTDMKSVPTGAYDAIWSSHNIEHLFHHEAQQAAAQLLRILNGSGWVMVTCPDIKSAMDHALKNGLADVMYQSSAGPITPRDVLFGHQASIRKGNEFMAHKNAFDLLSLRDLFQNAGFGRIYGERRGLNLWLIAGHFPTSEAAKTRFREILD